jgi:hypothetical protein
MSLSGNEFSTTSDKERTLAQCVGDPPASGCLIDGVPGDAEPTHASVYLPFGASRGKAQRIIARSEERLERSSL